MYALYPLIYNLAAKLKHSQAEAANIFLIVLASFVPWEQRVHINARVYLLSTELKICKIEYAICWKSPCSLSSSLLFTQHPQKQLVAWASWAWAIPLWHPPRPRHYLPRLHANASCSSYQTLWDQVSLYERNWRKHRDKFQPMIHSFRRTYLWDW